MTSPVNNQFLQIPYDVAVIIPTVLRPSLDKAVRSVFAQDINGRIQILIGIDKVVGSDEVLRDLVNDCPEHITLTILDMGYSTAKRNGGVHSCNFGGSLRSALTLLANSRYVAYLDDDNWFAPNHLSSLLKAIVGYDWAYSARWMVDPRNDTAICVDTWESVGLNRGVFAVGQGGFVDTNSMMLDKLLCLPVVSLWSMSVMARGDGEDRMVYGALKANYRGNATGLATTYYRITENDGMQSVRTKYFAAEGYHWGSASRFAKALTVEPDYPEDTISPHQKLIAGLITSAHRCELDGEPMAGMEIINQALLAFPNNPDISHFLAGFNHRLLDGLLKKARQDIKEGQYPQAVDVLSGILQAYPTEKQTLILLAQLNIKLKNVEDAKTIYDFLKETYPNDADVVQELAAQKFVLRSQTLAISL